MWSGTRLVARSWSCGTALEQRRDVARTTRRGARGCRRPRHPRTSGERAGERLDRLLALLLVDAESRRDRGDHEVGVRDGREVDERPAADGRARGEREACLPGPARSRERHEPASGRPRRAVIAASSSARPISSGRPSREAPPGRGLARQRRVVLEHAPLEAAKLRGRLEPELVERVAGLAVRRERIRLPPRAVEGDDPLCLEALAVRVRDDERLELSGERRVTPRREVEVDPRLERGEPALVEPRGGGLLRTARTRGRRAPGRARARAPRGDRPPRPASRSNRSTSSSSGSTRTRYPGGRVTIRSAPSAPRSEWTCTWSAFGRVRAATRPRSRRSAGRWRRPRSGGAAAVRAASGASAPRAQPAPRRRRPPPAAPASGTPTP